MPAEPQADAGPQGALREDIVESAVRFLHDSKVQSSTLAKKVAFLETKGLTNAEIEDALARAKGAPVQPGAADTTDGGSRGAGAPATYGYAQQMRPPAPPRPHLDWKDYFIAAVVAGGLGYGLFMLAKKYVAPLLAVSDDNKRLEEEKRLLVEQNELTRKQIEALSESTTRILDTLAQQSQKTGEAVEGLSSAVEGIATQGTEQRTQSARLLLVLEDLQREIAALSSAHSSKAGGNGSIADVQSDIRSLRSLLLSRRVPTAYSSSPAVRPSTPTAAAAEGGSGDRSPEAASPDATSGESQSAASAPTPTIPAWQLALEGGGSDKGKQAAE
ncbi:peroxisomal membrane protein pex14 [Coemansia sp. RSA 552]|nr:peroxisomal membrane protein pex14 [Coemansia sp. RSA 552]